MSIRFKSHGRSTGGDTTHPTTSTDAEQAAGELGAGTEDTITETPLQQGETGVAEDLRGINFTPTPFAQPPHLIHSGRTQYYRGPGITRPCTMNCVEYKAGKDIHRPSMQVVVAFAWNLQAKYIYTRQDSANQTSHTHRTARNNVSTLMTVL